MKVIYTRTIGVYDDKLNEAMEISKGLAEVRKKHYPDHEVFFHFKLVEILEQ
jgi:hypothetical protein